MSEKWERQEHESAAEYAAFAVFLEKRNLRETASATGKSLALMKRYSAENDWQARARELDKTTAAEVRAELSRQLTATLKQQWQDCCELKAAALNALKRKIDTANPRTLNEIYTAATAQQLKIVELLKLDETPPDNDLTIRIVSAGEDGKDEEWFTSKMPAKAPARRS